MKLSNKRNADVLKNLEQRIKESSLPDTQKKSTLSRLKSYGNLNSISSIESFLMLLTKLKIENIVLRLFKKS